MMGYSCSDFTDDVIDTLAIDIPDESWDCPEDQADLVIGRIREMQNLLSECRTHLTEGLMPKDIDDLVNRIDAVIGPVADAEGL